MLSSKLSRAEGGGGFQPVTEGHAIWESVYQIELQLAAELTSLLFTNTNRVSVIYNPLEYAQEVHLNYLKRFMNARKDVLYVGLNPGPNGMCQTGVRERFFWFTRNSN